MATITNTTPYDGEKTANATCALGQPAYGTDYVLFSNNDGQTVIRNCKSQKDLEEWFSIKRTESNKFSSSADGKYDRSSKESITLQFKNDFILRQESTLGEIYDDPQQIILTIRDPQGCNIQTGKDLYDMLMHFFGFIFTVKEDGSVDYTTLDRVLKGATVPAPLV